MNFIKKTLLCLAKPAGKPLLAILIVSAATYTSFAAPGEFKTPVEMLKESQRLVKAEKYAEAVDIMYLYLGEVRKSKSERVITIAQGVRYRQAAILISLDRLSEAVDPLQDYIKNDIAAHPRQARKLLSTCYYEMGDFENCVAATLEALDYNENPVLLAKKISQKGDEDEGFEDEVEEEEPFTPAEITLLNMTLGEAYFGTQSWKECIDPFSYAIEHTDDDQRKGYAIMQIINALIEIPDFDRIMEWIPKLYRTDARYDIRVNIALMNVAAALYDAKEYDSALPLFRMILPRDELIAHHEEKLREMRLSFGLPPEEGAEMTADEMMLFGVEETTATTEEGVVESLSPEEIARDKALNNQKKLLENLRGIEAYENRINYRMARLYNDIDRYWEGVRFFEKVFKADPTTETGEQAIYEEINTLLEEIDSLPDAEKKAFAYLQDYKEGVTPRLIAYDLTSYYQKRQQWEEIKALKPYIDSLGSSTNGMEKVELDMIVQYDTELYFSQAIADLIRQKFPAAEPGFKYVLDTFPNSRQESNCRYWYPMTMLFQQRYADALPEFEYYTKAFPDGNFVSESTYQCGVCMFGLEQYTNAMERFSYVIDHYSDSKILPEAASMRGDLYASGMVYDEDDFLVRAVADYQSAVTAANRLNKVKQATYATFKMAEVYEAEAEDFEERYDDIIVAVQAYLDEWQAEADIAKALFWIGKTKIQQDLIDEAVATYVEAIIEYGMDVRQDGVDLMIAELVKVSAIYLDGEQQTKLHSDLETALEEATDLTLKLRLRVTLAKLDRNEIELGKQLIAELPNLDNASPPVLATICEASFDIKDYSRAEELLQIFLLQFEDSEYMRSAYKLLGSGRYAEKDYEGALETIEEAQETYGSEYDVAWAQLMKAQILLDQNKFEEAYEANKYIMNVPAWRGAPVAQATYQMGQVEEKSGNLLKAAGMYQRTYFQFKGHAGGYWAAEGYLASARCLKALDRTNDARNTYRAMLFDRYVSSLPQAEIARKALGATEVGEIVDYIATGGTTNINVDVEIEKPKEEAVIKVTTEPMEEKPVASEENA